jgi:Xaa-Pro dipeptidase
MEGSQATGRASRVQVSEREHGGCSHGRRCRSKVLRMLQVEFANARKKRLLEAMKRAAVDAAVIGARRHVYYFTTHWTQWLHQSGIVLTADGHSTLVTANTILKTAAADDIRAYEAQWMATQRSEQPAVVGEKLLDVLRERQIKRIAIDASEVSSQVAMQWEGECKSIEPELWQMRRRKDLDELELMRKAIACTEAMYVRAREIVAPGIEELDVFNQLSAVAVKTAGERLTDILGNDFACAAPGGPPRQGRKVQAGEIYILDLGPCYRGYYADNCRSIAVDRKPSDEQMKAWEAVTGSFKIVEAMARPGARCKEIFEAVNDHLRRTHGSAIQHHLGHGVGLQPHEYPHLNPKWDDVLMEGEVIAVEPGVYAENLRGGIRIENNYVVTASGVTALLDSPMALV